MTEPVENLILDLTQQWTRAFQTRDIERLKQLITDDYSVMIGAEGQQILRVEREPWLKVAPEYETVSGSIDDIAVRVYGDTAVVWMLYTQVARIQGNDRSGQFVLNDVWVKQGNEWRMSARLSRRPDPRGAARPVTSR